jgi:hypothetical protein
MLTPQTAQISAHESLLQTSAHESGWALRAAHTVIVSQQSRSERGGSAQSGQIALESEGDSAAQICHGSFKQNMLLDVLFGWKDGRKLGEFGEKGAVPAVVAAASLDQVAEGQGTCN